MWYSSCTRQSLTCLEWTRLWHVTNNVVGSKNFSATMTAHWQDALKTCLGCIQAFPSCTLEASNMHTCYV